MAIYVFISANLPAEAWNRLVKRNDYPLGSFLGPKLWDYVTPVLQQLGHSVFPFICKDEYSYTLSDQIQLAQRQIIEYDLRNIILVGASYCGMIITGIANNMPDRIDRLIYVDAIVPTSGQSVKDIFSQAGFTPHIPIDTSPTYTEPLSFDVIKIRKTPKHYVLCTESNFKAVSALAKQNINADSENWSYVEIPTSHLPMITHPKLLNTVLLS